MISFENVKKMWEKDSIINSLDLDHESLRIPNVLMRYLDILSEYKMTLAKTKHDFSRLYAKKFLFLTGKMTDEEALQLGWVYDGNKILRQDIDKYLPGDEDIIKAKSKIEYYEIVISHVEEIIKSINKREWEIRNAIEWRKFTNGSAI